MDDVVVIGAGISGLTAAVKLLAAGFSVRVIEAESAPGGNIRSEKMGEYIVERGPHSFLGSSTAIWKLLADTGLSDSVAPATPAARWRYVYRDGAIQPLPLGPISFLTTGILSPRAKLRLLAEPFIRGAASPDDTITTFFRRRMGEEAARYLAGPFVSGIYAGDPDRLGAADSFPRFYRLESEHGSLVRGAIHLMLSGRHGSTDGAPPKRRGLFSFPAGLGQLAGALASRLGPRLSYGEAVERVEAAPSGAWELSMSKSIARARAVVVATPPHAAARLFDQADLREPLSRIRLAPVAVVHLGCAAGGDRIPRGFGCLVPRHYGIRTLGTVFVSQLFAGRAPENGALVTSFIGGALDPDAVGLSDDALIETAVSDFYRTTGTSISPDFTHVLRHEHAIPQFEIGYRRRIADLIERTRKHPGLFLAGNYISGVGINDAVLSGYAAAEGAAAYLRGGASMDTVTS